jgi:hypothetical protein
MSQKTDYLLLRGALLVADIDASGNPGAVEDLGEFSSFEISTTVDYADNFQTRTPISTQDMHVAKKMTITAEMKVKAATLKNIARAMYGEEVDDAGGSFSAAAFPAGILAGETHIVPGRRVNLSGVSIVDSAVSPATLVEGTHYTADLVYGKVTFLNVTGKTQPFKISGTEGASKSVIFATKRSQEKALFLHAVNIADDDQPVIVEIYRGALEAADKLALKTEEAAEMTFKVVLLGDETKENDDVLGQYGRYREL